MADIRKRTGPKGTTYQARYASTATITGYAYKTFKTRKEAQHFIESGEALRHSKQNSTLAGLRTIHDAIDYWLDVYEQEGREDRAPVSPSTLENYRWRARTMKSFDWPCELRDLRPSHVKAFRSWLKRNCKTDQAQKVLSSFHSVLIEMKDREVIADDPAQKISLRADTRKKEPVKIPTIEEFQRMLDAADRLANSKNNEIASA